MRKINYLLGRMEKTSKIVGRAGRPAVVGFIGGDDARGMSQDINDMLSMERKKKGRLRWMLTPSVVSAKVKSAKWGGPINPIYTDTGRKELRRILREELTELAAHRKEGRV